MVVQKVTEGKDKMQHLFYCNFCRLLSTFFDLQNPQYIIRNCREQTAATYQGLTVYSFHVIA